MERIQVKIMIPTEDEQAQFGCFVILLIIAVVLFSIAVIWKLITSF